MHKTPYVNQQRNQSTVDFSRIHAYFWIYFNHAREGMYLLGGSGTDVRTRTREQIKKKKQEGNLQPWMHTTTCVLGSIIPPLYTLEPEKVMALHSSTGGLRSMGS